MEQLYRRTRFGKRFARGDLVAFCDADDVVAPDWLEGLVAAAESADVVGGRLDIERLNDERWRALRPPPQPRPELHVSHGFLPYAAGCNMAVWRDVFDAVGDWREDYLRGYEDVELSWRAQLASFTLAYAPDAVIH